MKIAERLRHAREIARLSQTQVANHLGVAANTVCGWEVGERQPKIMQVAKLAELYGCTTDYLLGLANYAASFPVGQLLVDCDTVARVLAARTAAELEELVDWQPQFIPFWQVVAPHAAVRTRAQVTATTMSLMAHVQRVAPRLWQLYELGVEDMARRRAQWVKRRGPDEPDFGDRQPDDPNPDGGERRP